MPGTVLKVLCILDLIPTKFHEEYYYPYFAEEEIGTQRGFGY